MMDSIVEQEYADFIDNYGNCIEIDAEKKKVSEQDAKEVIKDYIRVESIVKGIESLCEEIESKVLFLEGIIPVPDEMCYKENA